MAIRNLLVLVTVVALISGCQTWQADKMPPTAALPPTSETGVVEARYWENLGGGGVSSVTSLAAYPDNPDEVSELNELRSPQNRGDYYGSLVRGFIIPPSDGIYRFFVAGDGETQFWLSTDSTPENAQMIALVPRSSAPNNYSQYNSQASGTIEMTANTRYYFEIRHKEISGGDHFNVAWEGPNLSRQVIGGDAIASLGQSPYEQGGEASAEDVQAAFALGYRVGFFDGTQGLTFNSEYPPLDQDQDGLYDNWETLHGLDPNDSTDAASDADGDILTALDEFWLATDPKNPDTDNDSIPDGVEFANELNPLNPEDANEDLDGDGATNLEEYLADTNMADVSDFPGMTDGDERSSGFVGQYFLGTEFNELVKVQQDSNINFSWGRGRPSPEMPEDEFSIRWIGTFTAPHSGGPREYRFTTSTDDGVRLYLDNQLVIDQWQNQGATPYRSTVSLSGSEVIPVTMEYFESCCGATARLTITDLSNNQELNLSDTVTAPEPQASATTGHDSNSDGIPDSWALAHGLNPWTSNANNSVNNSGVTNLEAYQSGLDPWTLETIGAGPAPTPPPEGSLSPTIGEVRLSWEPPSSRMDGSNLEPSEIQGYEVMYGQRPDSLSNTHPVAIGQTDTTISNLERGTWYFAVRTIADIPGPLSDPVEHTVP